MQRDGGAAKKTRFGVVILLGAILSAASQSPAQAQVRSEFGVMIPMRDGVKLAADVWLPEAPGRYPVLLARTPYMKTGLRLSQWAQYFASRGYVFAVQDTRGRGDSEGTFDAFFGEGKDGYDTIEWLAAQPWSNGRVGMLGPSYLGTVQWLAAREQPPHLACMAPTAAAGRWFEEFPYMGGAFSEVLALSWVNEVSGRIDQEANAENVDWAKVLAHRPLLTADSVMGRTMPLYRDWLTHSTTGPYWDRLRFTAKDFAAIDIPTLTVTGWYDGDQPGALFYWRGLTANAPHRDRHFLIVGPWRHIEAFRGGSTKVGDSEFSPESIVDTQAMHQAFFDWCLKGKSPGLDSPRARIYVTGANVWRTFDTYPPAAARPQDLYLTSSGHANTSTGDGRLSWERAADSPPDRFTFDPKNPVPGNLDDWGLDRQAIQRRDDVLVYTSDVLQEPLAVIGSVVVNLQAASDARDTDFTAVLSDVGPDGRALKLGPLVGIRRARYRNGYDREELLTPGRVENYRIELFDIAHSFEPGHRIRLEISSSAAPNYNPNQNTGSPVATDTEWKVARQTVYHDRTRASSITLPVVSGYARIAAAKALGGPLSARLPGAPVGGRSAGTRRGRVAAALPWRCAMQARCRRSLIWMAPLLVTALVGWGGARRAAAATDAPDLSWLAESACADGMEVAALDAPDWMAEPAATPAKPAPPAGGKSCTANGQCKAKQYCAKKEGDCKAKGECTAKPTICPLIFKPVCGCNGKTYSNSCLAAVAGVNVKSDGACPKPTGGNYTCKTNKDCPKDDFCAKDIGKCDDEGVCARRPICTALVVAPVCGCNDKTYNNQCLAHSAGENVKHDGKCEKK